MEKLNNIDQLNNYLPKDMIVEKYPQFTINQLTWLEINRERYQLTHAIKRIGRRLYFHVPSLIDWIEKQNS